MLDLLYVSAVYIMAIIGGLVLLAAIVGLYLCYRYDVTFSVHSKNKPEQKQGG